jgi:hypothetical protein
MIEPALFIYGRTLAVSGVPDPLRSARRPLTISSADQSHAVYRDYQRRPLGHKLPQIKLATCLYHAVVPPAPSRGTRKHSVSSGDGPPCR